ncbi:bifunctional alpha,alpha-trehalose-phosphate synthase (UDP-forming)/trehalose-phosphatase [Sediminitomix flava]|uniref:Trehalose 6-phosphate synthase/phosphatase n=1 Tax=Sediminitomix flava TaxID=379075 RepID=A0A315ZAR2_SEDFL|nr:bifunctional alpha,alpha-trehalose-phosphate synthase (UDP-forming)/trehalose-phosphatase [Sediminitomix flava]PWJ42382.1 trehalose 6-phosphate synthase/phosphatase [Sediminitomix flava]
MNNKKLVIVSNRLPVSININEDEFSFTKSAGGLATGLDSLSDELEKIWVGWAGIHTSDKDLKEKINTAFVEKDLYPIFFEEQLFEGYYEGFSNKIIWPHFHYFTQYTTYEEAYYEAYKTVNEIFAEELIKILKGDEMVWIHDYHLMLLPKLIRHKFPNISIGFFLHIPFPSYEIFRTLPWRNDLLTGVLGADLVGFHTFGYMRHFLSSVYNILGYENDFGIINIHDRLVHADVFPMGIDYDKFAFPDIKSVSKVFEIKENLPEARIILSVDRLDYTKGIPQRIKAFDAFLERYPEYLGKVYLVLVAVPSRTNVGHYKELKDEIETLIGRINGKYAQFRWTPIKYFYRNFNFEELVQLYQASDVAMITPLRDGMNLIAKEYVASRQDGKGVLVLSEMAGASFELIDALMVNPQNTNHVVEVLARALEMNPKEQELRIRNLQRRVKENNVQTWANTFIDEQLKISMMQKEKLTKFFNKDAQALNLTLMKQSSKRLILLDYDGTLMDFNSDPQAVEPDEFILSTLKTFTADPRNRVVVISGRDRDTLERWLGHLEVDISAEHGVWSRIDGDWQMSDGLFDSWKEQVRPVLENLVKRTPGTFLEEKQYSIVWHYRKIDKALGEKRIRAYRDVLQYMTANLDLQVLEGNKVVEVKNAGVNKGKATLNWLNMEDWEYVLAMGDDHTDEDIFKVLPDYATSVKVGLDMSDARYHLTSVKQVRTFLDKVIETLYSDSTKSAID